MIHNDKRIMMEMMSNAQTDIVDNGNVVSFELRDYKLDLIVDQGICNFYRQGIPSSRFAVHRYMVLVALKRIVEETIQQI